MQMVVLVGASNLEKVHAASKQRALMLLTLLFEGGLPPRKTFRYFQKGLWWKGSTTIAFLSLTSLETHPSNLNSTMGHNPCCSGRKQIHLAGNVVASSSTVFLKIAEILFPLLELTKVPLALLFHPCPRPWTPVKTFVQSDCPEEPAQKSPCLTWTFFFLNLFGGPEAPFCNYSPLPPLRGQPTVEYHPRWQPIQGLVST